MYHIYKCVNSFTALRYDCDRHVKEGDLYLVGEAKNGYVSIEKLERDSRSFEIHEAVLKKQFEKVTIQ